MKSAGELADAADMLTLAAAGEVRWEIWACTAAIGLGVVFSALRMIAADIDYARRCEALLEQARMMRERQAERLRNLRHRR